MTIKAFDYYHVVLKLESEMLGTCPAASIYDKHVLKKAQEQIKEANKLQKKVVKSLEKFKGVEVSQDKEIKELQGILRTYQEMLGITDDLPNDIEGLVELSTQYEETLKDSMKGEKSAPTVFMRDADGHAIISSHMILGNLKENLKIVVNNEPDKTKKLIPSKTACGEIGALDVKVIKPFIKPSNDIVRDENGKPFILERPGKMNGPNGVVVTILRSEMLPIGTTFEFDLRVRAGSPLTQEVLEYLFDLGKNNGLGSWRGSGHKGSYKFKISQLENYVEEADEDGFR